MNILHLDYDDLYTPFGSGGQARATYETYRRFGPSYKITVLTGNFPGARTVVRQGIRYERVGIGRFGPTISLLSYWLLVPFAVLLRHQRYHIIVECFTAPFSASLVPLFIKRPLVGIVCFLGARKMSQKYNLPFWMVESFLVRFYPSLIVFSEAIKREVRIFSRNNRIDIIPNGVDEVFFTSKTAEEPYILFMGRLDIYNKRLDVLIEAFSKIHIKYPHLRLILAGQGKNDDVKTLRQQVKRLGLTRSVVFTGWVEGKKKVKLLSNALCFVLLSRFETFGIAALEALACGKMLVTSAIPGLMWIPEEYCIRVRTTNVSSVEKALLKVISDHKLRSLRSMNAREYVKRYDWDIVAKQYERVFRDTITRFGEKNFLP